MLVRALVVGELPIRDALTKQSVAKGGEVVLDTDPGGRSGRWAGTLLDPLVESGAIQILGPHAQSPGS